MPKRRVRIPDTRGARARPKRERRAGENGPVPATREAIGGAASDVAGLQRLVGNRAVAQLLQSEAATRPAVSPAGARAVQRRHHRHGGGGQAPMVQAQPATMRVQIQAKKPKYDDGVGLTEATPGAGVTSAQIQAAITLMIQRFPLRGGRTALTDTAAQVMADLAGRVNAATGELGRNNSTSWRVEFEDWTGFRIDVENIRGRNLYA